MIRQLLVAASLVGVTFLASCFGQHNSAPNEGVNLDNTRIYGASREAKPDQLPNEYEKENVARIAKIREKLYPR